MRLIDLLLRTTGAATVHRFKRQCQRPMQLQREWLLGMLRRHADTVIGRRFGFATIRDIAGFQSRLPVMDYADHEPYIEASLEGKAGQLTTGSPCYFATTSGTTGTPKFIPVTRESRAASARALRVWLSRLHMDHPRLFSGRMLSVVSPEVESLSPAGVPCGAESGHGYRTAPRSLRSVYSSPYTTCEIRDYDARYYTLLRIAASQSVSFLFACNPSTVLLLAERMEAFAPQIIEDVRRGTLSERFEVPDAIRAQCRPYLEADPARAAALEAARERAGRLRPREVWPELAVIACWKGGSVGSYLDRFDGHFPPQVAIRDLGYLSSECRGSIPLSDDGASGPLSVATHFFEFLPVDHPGGAGPGDLLTLDRLRAGERYFIHVTTLGGLYRYDMNDIVEVTGHYGNTPMIRFVQKGKGVVSFTGEKLYETQAIEAVDRALATVRGRYDFIAALGAMEAGQPRYTFLVEFDQPPPRASALEWAQAIDGQLRKQNSEYRGKRASQRLLPAALAVVSPGAFARYRRREVEGGRPDGQFKILKLTQDADWASEFEQEYVVRPESQPGKQNHDD